MPAAKRTRDQRNADLPFIAELYLKGYPQGQIAEHLSKEREYEVSRHTIGRDIKSIQKRWLKSQIRDFDLARSQELARLDVIEAELWKEWERSKLPKETTVNEAQSRSGEHSQGETQQASSKKVERVEGQRGDVAYLREVLKIIDMRLRILGLYAPEASVIGYVDINKLDEAREKRWGEAERIYKEAAVVIDIIDQSNGQVDLDGQEPENIGDSNE